MLIVLSDVLELLVAQRAIECAQRRRDLGLERILARDGVLSGAWAGVSATPNANEPLTHLAQFPLLLALLLLSLRIEPAALGYRGLDHTNILCRLPQARQIRFDVERDGLGAP